MIRKFGLAHRLALLGSVLLIVSCKSEGGVEPLVVTTVSVSSAPTQITVNETAQASAIVKDQNGNPLTGKSVEWTSLNTNIATVTSAGVIRGVAPGTATIQGRVDGVVGTATVIVVAPVAACEGGATVVDPAPGAVRVVSAAESKGCIRIPSAAAASEYVVIAANANPIPDQPGDYVIKSDEGDAVPSTNLLASPQRVIASLEVTPAPFDGAAQDEFEQKIRRLERATLDVPVAQRAFRNRTYGALRNYSISAAIPTVGEKTPFKIPESCSKFTNITATVQYISTRAIIYTDDASPPGGFTSTDFQQIGDEFDALIYPTNIAYFGSPIDLDNNGRVVILYTPEVNKLTPANNPGGFVGGFFFAGDLFPSTGVNSCPQSNVAELFYLLSPDPDGTINGNKRSTASVRQGTRGTIAHEFQHMINASETIRSTIKHEFESVWLNEALSHLIEEATGRVLKGIGPAENADFARLSSNVNDFNAYFFQNFARFRGYLQAPGVNPPTSAEAESSLAVRGAAWAFLRYTADHYSPNGNEKELTRALVVGPDTGVVNLVKRTNAPFDTLLAGWMVANYADDLGIPGLAQKYTYTSYNIRSNVAAITTPSRTYPLVVNQIGTGSYVSPTLQAKSGTGNYFQFARPAGAQARTFRFLNPDGRTTASFTGATLYILRSQ